jgi:hypothetical protein
MAPIADAVNRNRQQGGCKRSSAVSVAIAEGATLWGKMLGPQGHRHHG